jgi:hypothetical protein
MSQLRPCERGFHLLKPRFRSAAVVSCEATRQINTRTATNKLAAVMRCHLSRRQGRSIATGSSRSDQVYPPWSLSRALHSCGA